MHCDNLLDIFYLNIREPASQKHPVQERADRKTRKTSEGIQGQSQKSQSTSSDSDKKDINFTPNQLIFRRGEKGEKRRPKSDNSSNNLNENKHEDDSATDMKAPQRISSATDMKASQGINSATDTEAFQKISSTTDKNVASGKMGKVEKGAYYGTREE